MKCMELEDFRYREQQKALDEIATRFGVVAYRPEYHRKARDKNTVLFYTKEDAKHNRQVDREPIHYSQSEARDRMKYQKVEIPDEYIWRDHFWSFENTDANGVLDYGFANFGKVDLRSSRWEEILEGHIQLAIARKYQYAHVRSCGGYLEMREADEINNDLNREKIAAMRKIYETVYLLDVNYFDEKRRRIVAGEESVYEEVTDAPIYNFAGSYCVPTKDAELEELIRRWNADDSLPKSGVKVEQITNRVDAIGGIILVWF